MDVSVTGSYGFYTFITHTSEAVTWVEQNVDKASWNGNAQVFHVDDTGLAESITHGMLQEGLEVELNGVEQSLE